MFKVLLSTLLILFLTGCSEQEANEQDMENIQAAMLKGLCENETACLNKIDTLAETCHQSHADRVDFDALSEMDQIKAIGEFSACIIRQMDQDFQDRYNQAMPVTVTGDEISRSAQKFNPKDALLVFVKQNGISIADKSQKVKIIPLENIKAVIQDQKLTDKYSTVIFLVNKEVDTEDFVEVADIFKSAGFEIISNAAREH